jgi:hypothetical protein
MEHNIDIDSNKRFYNILVYGIERVGLTIPSNEIQTRNYKLTFEPFYAQRRLDEFDGVILFQGVFESFREVEFRGGLISGLVCDYDCNELDKRTKELELLLGNKGFVCFLLCKAFIDYASGDCKSTDLCKRLLNYNSFYRESKSGRAITIKSKRSEFDNFLKRFGAAYTSFNNSNDRIDMRVIAEISNHIVGMILFENMFFVPSLIPDNNPNVIEEYFQLLTDALIATCNKLVFEIPEWLKEFRFSEEVYLTNEKEKIESQLQQIIEQFEILQKFKRILLLDGELLVEAVVDVLRNGFNLKIDDKDEYKEDLKILDDNNNPIVFVEIKGTNKGIERKYINQCDTHRQEANLPPEFPSILIINTHIKNSRTIAEKDQPVPDDQIRHAVRNNVLILRTLDLLLLLAQIRNKNIDLKIKDIISELTTKCGWMKASSEGWEIINIS